MPIDRGRLASNAEAVRRRVEAACRRAGRDAASVTLIVVTKYVGLECIEALLDLGFTDLAENRAVEGGAKVAHVARPARWHFVGHLQTNKAKKALERFHVFHSIDRRELAMELQRRLMGNNKTVPAFVQVNVSGETSKGGVPASEAPAFVDWVRKMTPNLALQGLMTMAPEAEPESARPVFRGLRGLAETCGLRGLSMGMSNDFEVALEEGATHVRVGSAFFAGVEA